MTGTALTHRFAPGRVIAWLLLLAGGLLMLTPLLFMFSTSLRIRPTSTISG
jgi:multiple sugar transport system permease protein